MSENDTAPGIDPASTQFAGRVGRGNITTYGQAAFCDYYGRQAGAAVVMPDSWDMQSDATRADWEAAAQAVLNRAFPGLRRERDEARAEAARLRGLLSEARIAEPASDRQGDETAKPARELAEAMAETRRVAETVRPILDCFKRASDGWRGRVSAVVLARAYAATGAVPDYLRHVEGQ